MSKQIISKKPPSFIVDKRAKAQAIIRLCMKYSWGFQTAPESPASLGPLLLAEIQTHPLQENKLPLAINTLAITLMRDRSYDDHMRLELS